MDAASVDVEQPHEPIGTGGHRLWVRLTHWLIAIAVVILIYSGVAILMVHPRLYWGNTGNDLVRPLLEIPLGPNYKHGSWAPATPFFALPDSPVTANRMKEPWNQNGWARSLHFLAAWCFIGGLMTYLAGSLATGHLRRNLVPRRAELARKHVWLDIEAHMQLPPKSVEISGSRYGILQKLAYVTVIVVALPLMFLTGITMSPAITADYPILLDIFGGTQSARTVHFFTFAFLALFLLIHLAMILLTGPVRQLRAMILGS